MRRGASNSHSPDGGAHKIFQLLKCKSVAGKGRNEVKRLRLDRMGEGKNKVSERERERGMR